MSRLAAAPIGCVPILWNNVDVPDLAPLEPHPTILETFARIGYDGTQFGRGFPEGADLRQEMAAHGLRLAELYSALPADAHDLADGAEEIARRDLRRTVDGGGEVLVVALDGAAPCDAVAGRVGADTVRWPDAAFDRLARLLGELAEAAPSGVRVAFHPHTATFIEGPAEVDALAVRLAGTRAGLCLDVGHYLVGGGDPVEAIGRHGALVTHVHAKDVDPAVLARLRGGELASFGDAVRERLFTELGRGALDVRGVVEALDGIGFDGWIMCEQDSTWLAPAEAAAAGHAVIRHAIRELDR